MDFSKAQSQPLSLRIVDVTSVNNKAGIRSLEIIVCLHRPQKEIHFFRRFVFFIYEIP